VVAEKSRGALGVIELKDVVKGGIRERFNHLRAMGNQDRDDHGRQSAHRAAIAREAGVDDFLAQATPKDKMDLIKKEQDEGKLVAMTGDARTTPRLWRSRCWVAMNTGNKRPKKRQTWWTCDSNPRS